MMNTNDHAQQLFIENQSLKSNIESMNQTNQAMAHRLLDVSSKLKELRKAHGELLMAYRDLLNESH